MMDTLGFTVYDITITEIRSNAVQATIMFRLPQTVVVDTVRCGVHVTVLH